MAISRQRLHAWIRAVKQVRDGMTDEAAEATPAIFPAWAVDKNYQTGDRISYNGKAYRVLQAHHSQADWAPDVAVSLFAEVRAEGTIEEWKQPESTNPYMKGDKVRHNGKTWESLVDGNVWEPGVYGWQEK